MADPGNGRGRPGRGGQRVEMVGGTKATVTAPSDTRTGARLCGECRGRPASPGYHTCVQCRAEFAAGQRRRRDAELRLVPLADVLGVAS